MSLNLFCFTVIFSFISAATKITSLVLCHTGLVYIAGGFNGQECLSSAEYYDPIVNQWTMIAHMRSKRSGVGIATYCGHVYAVGGFDGTHRLFSAERYDPDINKWQPVASMCSSRSNFAIEVRRLTRSESGSVGLIQKQNTH